MSGRLLPGCLGFLLLLGAACVAQESVVALKLDGMPEGAQRVRVAAVLEGRPVQEVLEINDASDRFNLRFRPGTLGRVVIFAEVEGEDEKYGLGIRARGRTEVMLLGLPGELVEATMLLASLPRALCPREQSFCPEAADWGALALAGGQTDEVLAAGQDGLILRRTGQGWVRSGSEEKGVTFWSAFALPDAAWVGGDAGVIRMRTSYDWKQQRVIAEDPNLLNLRVTGLWASSREDVWAVGAGIGDGPGKAARYLLRWSRDKQGFVPDLQSPPSLVGLWGSSRSDVWAVGCSIVHYDGRSWRSEREVDGVDLSSDDRCLHGIWGSGPSDVWAVGESGLIFHYDGESWRRFPSGTDKILWQVHGSGPADVWAAGSNEADGVVLHWDGVRWSEVYASPGAVIYGVHARGPFEVWIVKGGSVLRRLL